MQDKKERKIRTWVRVAHVYQKAFRALGERLTEVGLSVAQFDLLACLIKAEPELLKQSELANRLLVTKGNISGMLNRMTEQGLVTRGDDENDRRSKRIQITAQGRELYQRGRELQDVLLDEMFEGLEQDKVEFLEQVVIDICERIDSSCRSQKKE